ncbi:MAG: hypothetical protein KC736_05130 [Candidatus Moranbacteria bacterium]|nr:hypothetical protein [Candidatus Moranbacteria bacterium]
MEKMKSEEKFARLNSLIESYFHQDYDLIADTVEGLMEDFMETHTPEEIVATQKDVSCFLQIPKNKME